MRAAPELTKTHLWIFFVVCLVVAFGAVVCNTHDPLAKPATARSAGQPIARRAPLRTADVQ